MAKFELSLKWIWYFLLTIPSTVQYDCTTLLFDEILF